MGLLLLVLAVTTVALNSVEGSRFGLASAINSAFSETAGPLSDYGRQGSRRREKMQHLANPDQRLRNRESRLDGQAPITCRRTR